MIRKEVTGSEFLRNTNCCTIRIVLLVHLEHICIFRAFGRCDACAMFEARCNGHEYIGDGFKWLLNIVWYLMKLSKKISIDYWYSHY